MPIYEYKCLQCGKSFELRRKFSDAPLTVHEGCGGQLEKVLSAPALQFKGSGWYVTDYGRGNNSSPTNGKSESKSESKKEATETKTATKTETKPAVTATDK